jgi:hypothetical protein
MAARRRRQPEADRGLHASGYAGSDLVEFGFRRRLPISNGWSKRGCSNPKASDEVGTT